MKGVFFKNVFSFVILVLAIVKLSAQNQVRGSGNIKTIKVGGNTISITTDNSFASVTVYSPNIIRVRLDKQPLKKDFSYAVVGMPEKTRVLIVNAANEITITTDSLKAIIQKTPFSISYYTLDGTVINEEEKGLNASWIGTEVTAYRHMQNDERFIGLGEKTGNLDRRGNGYTNWNSDVFGYRVDQDPLYSSIPFYIGIHDRLNYGIFLDNTFQSDFNFGASNDRFSSFGARDGEMNYYFIYHTKLSDIIKSYTALTGRMKMPPLWSLGYQQNRYSYYPDTEVMRIAQTLREKKIPADGITLDIHYMDRYQLFTWDKERFPNPMKTMTKLKEMGFKTTVIVDPGIKIEPGALAYQEGLKEDVFIKYSDGQNYAGQVWPGWCNFTDFTTEKGRSFWRNKMKFFADNGVSGIWNDMNEIASWGNKMPNNLLFGFEGRKGTLLEAHNVYGSLMARSSYEGAKAATNERPFILTRAGYAGLQRYTGIWTGDNRSEDGHMLAGIRLLNSLGLSGVAFTGMDIGGFTGNPSQGLYARWMQVGAFTPYFRNHTAVNTKSSEPWTYGEEITDISRNYIGLRYKLMPYLYGAFYEATQTGMPVVRSLAIENTYDDQVYNPAFQNQFLFGPSLLVVPVESQARFAKIYLPAGAWYDLYLDKKEDGGNEKLIELDAQTLPVYVKESSIIPMQTLVQTTAVAPADTLFLHIYKGRIFNTYTYYEDDGISFNYERGDFYRRDIAYDPAQNKLIFEKAEGKMLSKFNTISLVLHGFDSLQQITIDNKALPLRQTITSMLSAISQSDPQEAVNTVRGARTLTTAFKNSNENITIGF